MKINSILSEVLKENILDVGEKKFIDENVKNFVEYISKNASKLGKKPEIFLGGSYAKKTMIKKEKYDVDIFIRFDSSYDDEKISDLLGNILKGVKNVVRIHGSRDYFRICAGRNLEIEVIPVIKINKNVEAKNITDLSYSHVKYINSKIKTDKLLDDIKIAKIFCHANNCYGAESYIKGFSGYALELLVYHYKGFLNMLKGLSKDLPKNEEKIIIDTDKNYKSKRNILLDLNTSKIQSPIILIDPTYPQRNALAALSNETFERFKKACKGFLKKPSKEFFVSKKMDINKVREDALNKKQEFVLLEILTDKQEGDVAGSKLLKFYNYMSSDLDRFFEIKNKGFNYNGNKSARCFFVVEKKKEIIYGGPSIKDIKNVKKFRKEHSVVKDKNGKLYAIEKVKFNVKDFFKKWKIKNKKIIFEMSILDLNIIHNI